MRRVCECAHSQHLDSESGHGRATRRKQMRTRGKKGVEAGGWHGETSTWLLLMRSRDAASGDEASHTHTHTHTRTENNMPQSVAAHTRRKEWREKTRKSTLSGSQKTCIIPDPLLISWASTPFSLVLVDGRHVEVPLIFFVPVSRCRSKEREGGKERRSDEVSNFEKSGAFQITTNEKRNRNRERHTAACSCQPVIPTKKLRRTHAREYAHITPL